MRIFTTDNKEITSILQTLDCQIMCSWATGANVISYFVENEHGTYSGVLKDDCYRAINETAFEYASGENTLKFNRNSIKSIEVEYAGDCTRFVVSYDTQKITFIILAELAKAV